MTSAAPSLEIRPAFLPPLDPGFRPIALGNRNRERQLLQAASVPVVLALERNDGLVSTHRARIAVTAEELDVESARYLERLVKALLWQIGGWRLWISAPAALARHIADIYSRTGARAFDVQLMERVYERAFVVTPAAPAELPPARESAVALGGNLDGCRIGFDLGASDYKLAAVKDGEAVFTTEIPWNPKEEPDPEFHYRRIQDGLKLAARHLPRVDAIGGSSAGIYIDNRVMVASLFRAVPAPLFAEKVKPLFLRLGEEWDLPFEVANDGDVTALAGGMALGARGVLGIAMGSSQAAGFLDPHGRITGWLNELAFAPVDYQANGPIDEWSGDRGCGAQYFSQQAVGRLIPSAGLPIDPALPLPEKLVRVQHHMKEGDPRAAAIYETIGVYLGYALAQYAEFYDCRHCLVLGRVTTGAGGDLIVGKARQVLAAEFPELASRLALHLPDEKTKRVGQAVAAASLPALRR